MASPVHGQLVFSESFRYETAPGWEFQRDGSGTTPGARLTANAVPDSADPESGAPQIDVAGNGWLRLATTTGNQANAVALDTVIPSSANTINVAFDFAFWKPGTAPADGITVFLWDAGQAFDPGAYGGSLGYAQRTGVDGLAGAYMGVGLDVYGNFPNGGEGREGDITGLVPNNVTVRGGGSGGSGYDFIDGTVDSTSGSANSTLFTNLDFPNSPNRPDQDALDFRRFEMELDANDQLTVWITSGYGNTRTQILQTNIPGVRPDQLRIGYSGSTGGANEVYEIRNFEVEASGAANSFYWDDENGNEFWDTGENWDQDSVPVDHSFVVFTDQFPDTIVDQTVNLNGGDKTINSATFNGSSGYTLTPTGSQALIFDTDGTGKSYINVLNSPNGNADHTINADIQTNNDLDIQNFVNQALDLNGDILGNGNDLAFETFGTTRADGDISGSGTDIVVNGDGVTIFTGDNSYTGTTTVEEGRLQIENDNALGNAGADTVVEDGGTLALAGNITTPVGESLDIEGDGDEGTGALVNAAGSNVFSGDVDLTDDATIGSEAGTLVVSGDVVAGGDDLTLYANTGAELAVSGEISGGGTDVTKTGAGTAILSDNNSYDGTTTVDGGTLRVENSGALGNTAGDTVVNSGGTVEFAGNLTIGGGEDFTISGNGVAGKAALWSESGSSEIDGSVTITGGAAAVGAQAGATLTVDGGFEGSGQDLIITGTGTTIFASPEGSQSGSTTIENGATVEYRDAGERINDSSALIVDGTLDMSNGGYDEIVGSLAGSGTIRTRGAELTAGGDNTSTTFSGSIQDGGDFTKEGTGNMTFTGSNSFDGELTVSGGTVTLGAADVFADDMDLTLDGGTFATNGFADTIDNFDLAASSTMDYLSTAGGYLTFDAATYGSGTMDVDNWIGDYENGNGSSRFQVTSGSVTGEMQDLADNTQFLGWGDSSTWINVGGGVQELVPELTGWFEWDGSSSDDWDNRFNWTLVGGGTPSDYPDDDNDRVLITDLDTNLSSNGIDTSGSGNEWDLRDMVINNDVAFTIFGDNAIRFNQPGNDDTNLTIAGSSSPTFEATVDGVDPLYIRNLSTGTTEFDLIDISDRSLSEALLEFSGPGLTIVNSITGSTNDPLLVTHSGPGILRLTGDNSEIDSGFVLNGGTVQIGENEAMGTASITINGGTLAGWGADRNVSENFTVNNDFTIGNDDNRNLTLSGDGTLAAGQQTITVESGITGTLGSNGGDGDLTGSGGITKEGTGVLRLDGNNSTYSGDTIVNDGTLQVAAGGSSITLGGSSGNQNFLGTGDVTVNPGGTLDLDTDNDLTIASGGTLTNAGGTIDADIGNGGTGDDIFFAGDFTQTSGSSTFTANAGDVRQSGGSDITISGGSADFELGDDFSTGNGGSTFSVTNGADVSIDADGGAASSNLSFEQNDTLTVDGSGSTLTLTTEEAGTVDFDGEVQLTNSGQITVAQGATVFDVNATFDGGNASTAGTLTVSDDLTFGKGMDIANAPNVTFDIANGDSAQLDGSAANTTAENLGTITKTGEGELTIGSNISNIQATRISITGGTLLSGDSDQIENFVPMTLAGATWNTGGYDEVLGELTLDGTSGTSTLNLAAGTSVIEFADSSDESWTGSDDLEITNWSGSIWGGGTDQVIFGSDDSGLTTSQLGRVQFINPFGDGEDYDAKILPSGEVVPNVPVPEPSTWFMGALLLGFAGWHGWRRRGQVPQERAGESSP